MSAGSSLPEADAAEVMQHLPTYRGGGVGGGDEGVKEEQCEVRKAMSYQEYKKYDEEKKKEK